MKYLAESYPQERFNSIVYGNHKERLETIQTDDQNDNHCGFVAMDNFVSILDSASSVTNKMHREGDRGQLRFAQATPFEKDLASDRNHPRKSMRDNDNIGSYRAYAIVTATEEV